jgi:hypothetical protein
MAKDDKLTITAERTNGGKIQGHLRHLYGCARRWKLATPTRGANTKRHMLREPMMQDSEFITHENDQPIYKLHGCNWFAEPQGERLLVIGGNKTASIGTFQVLARYQAEFQAMLSQLDTRLMVIGYGFGDPHINSTIQTAAATGLRIFIVDTLGVDVIDKRNSRAQIPENHGSVSACFNL